MNMKYKGTVELHGMSFDVQFTVNDPEPDVGINDYYVEVTDMSGPCAVDEDLMQEAEELLLRDYV